MDRNPRNVPGDWYIDMRCIDCGASPHVAPDLISHASGRCVFHRQPVTDDELQQAWLAVDVCPTKSVGGPPHAPRPAHTLPLELDDGVFLLGYNSPSSYGAHSWLVQRTSGNLMVDSPTYTRRLTGEIDALGGIRHVLLSHRDDVADAEKWAARYGATVHIHADDAVAAPFATDIIAGTDPVPIADGVIAIPVPGHTKGSVVYLVDDAWLFTGDSLAWDREAKELEAFRDACWYSWSVQSSSLTKLAEHRFVRVFAGHGSWSPSLSAEEMHEHLLTLVAQM
jgi:glyoxylase-like metal-dependent hydrolase (beta-lactamase superfamily II)